MKSLGAAASRLTEVLRTPSLALAFSDTQWSELVAVARTTNLIGPLAAKLADASVTAPPRAERHLEGARQLATRQRLSVRWEAHGLQATLGGLGIPVMLLKGAAYVMSPDQLGAGRMFGDIDVLVPRDALGDVERALMLDGWVSAKTDAYDQRYYREWMHELPPMMHIRRGTVIDVHHTILPLTARNVPDPARILARAQAVPGLPALHVPAAEDLLIHSVTHLVHEGELNNGLRDLHDIDSLLRKFGQLPGFWTRLVAHAAGNDLAGPLALGLQLARTVFDSPVNADALSALTDAAGATWRRPWLPAVYVHALRPQSATDSDLRAGLARFLIYVRAHALRMPAHLLLRHLAIKAWKGLAGPKPAT